MADVLVVTSKVKKYIKEKKGFNTSGATIGALSAAVQKICDQAISNAEKDGRKTVMDRDVPPVLA